MRPSKKGKQRFGIAAEAKRAKIVFPDLKEDKKKAKRKSVSEVYSIPNEDIPIEATSYWAKIGNIPLTFELKEILLHPLGWLSDEHINAAQNLLKELGTGIGGLHNTIAIRHWKLMPLTAERFQSVQCHNIGNHWVTSTTILGQVVVYESLSTSLSFALRQQIVALYKNFANADGSLEVEVVLQQKQIGGSHCGLFCIANATAIVMGMDPTTCEWNQAAMREHLAKCIDKKKIETFPHKKRNIFEKSTQATHIISIHCVCLGHNPEAKVVVCSKCNKNYHYEKPRCIHLTAKQAAAILTNEPFICHRCEK